MTASVPVIDIGPSFDGSKQARRAIALSIGEACERIGFFAIEGHHVEAELIEQAFRSAAEFYDLPQSSKDESRPASSASARGYHKLGTKNLAKTLGYDRPPDLREQFYIGPLEDWSGHYERFPEAGFLYAPNIWPQAPASYRPTFTAYYRALEQLAKHLMRLFALALDLDENFFASRIDRHFSTLPTNDYPALDYQPEPEQLRCGEHSDFGSLTVLAVGPGQSGLQVHTRSGEWIDVVTARGQFIVNIGDMMQRWTNDRWLSNLHRVINPPLRDSCGMRRQSMGFFLHPNFDAVVECLPSCQDGARPPRYEAKLAGALMIEKMRARAA